MSNGKVKIFTFENWVLFVMNHLLKLTDHVLFKLLLVSHSCGTNDSEPFHFVVHLILFITMVVQELIVHVSCYEWVWINTSRIGRVVLTTLTLLALEVHVILLLSDSCSQVDVHSFLIKVLILNVFDASFILFTHSVQLADVDFVKFGGECSLKVIETLVPVDRR